MKNKVPNSEFGARVADADVMPPSKLWILRWWPLLAPLLFVIQVIFSRVTHYQLSFEWWVLNSVYMALLGVSVPICLWVLFGWIRNFWFRRPLRAALVLILPLYALAVASPVFRRASWEVVAEVQANGATYRAYRRPFYIYDTAVELRREVHIFPGLKLVEGPRRAPNSDRAELRVVDDGRVEAKIHNYNGKEWNYIFPQ